MLLVRLYLTLFEQLIVILLYSISSPNGENPVT